eukprot:scaffold65870_cov35-Tisochrysis_lutea.AAC.3
MGGAVRGEHVARDVVGHDEQHVGCHPTGPPGDGGKREWGGSGGAEGGAVPPPHCVERVVVRASRKNIVSLKKIGLLEKGTFAPSRSRALLSS